VVVLGSKVLALLTGVVVKVMLFVQVYSRTVKV